MEIEIRDITPEEAAPYGEDADIVLTGRKAVVFTDADGNAGRLYMKEEDIDLLGKQYIAENSTLEYSKVCEEWFPKVSWNAYKNDPQRNPPKTIDVEFVCDMGSERTEIWRRLDTGGYLMRKLCNEPFARWLVCRERQGWWEDGPASARTSRSDTGSKPRRCGTTTGMKQPRTATPSIRILGRDKDA